MQSYGSDSLDAAAPHDAARDLHLAHRPAMMSTLDAINRSPSHGRARLGQPRVPLRRRAHAGRDPGRRGHVQHLHLLAGGGPGARGRPHRPRSGCARRGSSSSRCSGTRTTSACTRRRRAPPARPSATSPRPSPTSGLISAATNLDRALGGGAAVAPPTATRAPIPSSRLTQRVTDRVENAPAVPAAHLDGEVRRVERDPVVGVRLAARAQRDGRPRLGHQHGAPDGQVVRAHVAREPEVQVAGQEQVDARRLRRLQRLEAARPPRAGSGSPGEGTNGWWVTSTLKTRSGMGREALADLLDLGPGDAAVLERPGARGVHPHHGEVLVVEERARGPA